MGTNPEDLYRRFEKELAKYEDRRVRQVLSMLETARTDLFDAIAESTEFNRKRLTNLVLQIDLISSRLQRELSSVAPASDELAPTVAAQQERAIKAITGLDVRISIGVLNDDVIRRFSLDVLGQVRSITAQSELNAIKAALFSKIGVQGLNPVKVARELAGREGMFTGRYALVETILRTETSTVYNEQGLRSILHANETYKLGLHKKIVETIDNKRNHPISQVLNGQVQYADQVFKASVSKVEAVASKLGRGRKGAGIFWSKVGEFYVGDRPPAHYRERGTVVASKDPVNAP